MKQNNLYLAALVVATATVLVSCGDQGKAADPAQEAPPAAQITEEPDLNLIKVDHPEHFPLVSAGQREDLPQLNVTGTINPDVERSIPVISLASGRVVELDAKLGDDVKKGQLLLKVLSNDISTAYQNFSQARADEALAKKQLERAQLLYQHGAISLNDMQVAEDTEAKAKVALDSTTRQLRTMGGNTDNDSSVVNVVAPASGTIVEQNIYKDGAVHTPDNQPNLFTIADLSIVWALCDVYENDLPIVRIGDRVDVRLNAYPDLRFQGRISNIGKILDPNLRTTKVRIDLRNPGMMRSGMFITATFYGKHGRAYATVPASAVLHLHDRDWVFVPAGSNQFRRTAVTGGKTVEGQQQLTSGLKPGAQVVSNALAIEAESQQ